MSIRPRPPRDAWVALGILMALFVLHYLDKQILPLLANLVGPALSLSDTQLGLLQGFAFTLPYASGVVVMGWAVDRFPRRSLLFCGVVLWSVSAMASGLATSFGTLAATRAFLGLGEAALVPAAMSIIATMFPRDRVTMAVGTFYSAGNIGGVIAVLLGGGIIQAMVDQGGLLIPNVGHFEPWRAAFILTGLPGLLMAFLVIAIRINDKGRGRNASASRAAGAAGAAAGLWSYLGKRKLFFATYTVSICALTLCAYTMTAWGAAYFGRIYQWDHRTIGMVLAASLMFGMAGHIVWGNLADRLIRKGRADAIYRIFIPLMLLTPLLAIPAFIVGNPVLSVAAFALAGMVYNGHGAAAAALQLVAPDQFRGRLTALKMIFTITIGIGGGPVVTGYLTDYVFQDRMMLGYSMTIALFGASLIGAAALIIGRKAYVRAVLSEQEAEEAQLSGAPAPAQA